MVIALGPRELALWQRYVGSHPGDDSLAGAHVTAGPAGGALLTDTLLALYLSGTKTAGSSLVADFVTAGDPLPRVGDHWICLDGAGEPRCILRTARVVVSRFADVSAETALAEGEGDLSLEHWRRAHREAWSPFLEGWGIRDLDQAEVVTEHLEVVLR